MTSRSESRNRDAEKVDLINKDESSVGRLPIEFQCKNTCSGVNYNKILNDMPGRGYRCILHRYTRKSKEGKFITKGEYAILPMDDFIELVNKIYGKE